MDLHEKYRPTTVELLKGDYSSLIDATKHNYLITGPSGSGKTTISKIIANNVGAEESDIIYWNVSDKNSVNDARYLLDKTMYSPQGKAWVIILDEVHRASQNFFDAILIPMETTVKNVYWILCTSERQKVLDTVASRCKQIITNPISDDNMYELLRDIASKESISIPNQIINDIVSASKGNARTAITTLETVAPMANVDREAYIAKMYGDESPEIIEIARMFWSHTADWKEFVSKLLPYKGTNLIETIRITTLSYGVTLLSKNHNVNAVKKCNYLLETTYQNGYSDLIVMFAKAWQV